MNTMSSPTSPSIISCRPGFELGRHLPGNPAGRGNEHDVLQAVAADREDQLVDHLPEVGLAPGADHVPVGDQLGDATEPLLAGGVAAAARQAPALFLQPTLLQLGGQQLDLGPIEQLLEDVGILVAQLAYR